jgi:hypothetical protein
MVSLAEPAYNGSYLRLTANTFRVFLAGHPTMNVLQKGVETAE